MGSLYKHLSFIEYKLYIMPKKQAQQKTVAAAKPSVKLVIEKLHKDPQPGRSFKNTFKKTIIRKSDKIKKPAPPKRLPVQQEQSSPSPAESKPVM